MPSQGYVCASSIIHDGTYALDVPYQRDDWVVEMQEPGEPLTRVTGVEVGLHEAKKLDIAAIHGGRVCGRVDAGPAIWKNDTWVVAFTRDGLRYEARVAADGSYSFDCLPPDVYGLKAGYDAFFDVERPVPETLADDDAAYRSPSDPWNRAKVVKVEPDQTVKDVRLGLPER